jgi:peroxisomal 3,2-trans-enoyl-CoA isomerase
MGLVAKGGASIAFVQRLGISKANEALIMSKPITCEELVVTGFVNKVFQVGQEESERFLELELEEVEERLGEYLNSESLVRVKKLIRRPGRTAVDAQTVADVIGGLKALTEGTPRKEFVRVTSGEKKHKS